MLAWLRRCAVGCCLLLAGAVAQACAICAPPDGQATVLYRLFAADVVALATRTPDGQAYQIVDVAKGEAPARQVKVASWWSAGAPADPSRPVVLVYSAAAQRWQGAGTLDLQRADWLRRILTVLPASRLAHVDWPARLAGFVADLEDPEALVAQAAYEEIASAPYAAMRALKPHLRASALRSWREDPARSARQPLYTLLWGLAGGPQDATVLQRQLQVLAPQADLSRLSAAIAAYVELGGPAAVAWLEREYLANRARSQAEVQATVLALSIHGNDGLRVPRERIVAAYALLAGTNRALAGLAASDLASWGHWELGPAYAEILHSGEPIVFAARYAMVFYLMRSPRPDARAALESLRVANRL